MKIGDLVIMPGSGIVPERPAIGIIVTPRVNRGKTRRTARIGVMWSDGDGVRLWLGRYSADLYPPLPV